MTRRILYTLIFTMISLHLCAQSEPENNQVLSLKQFFEIVYTNHPLSKQAKLIVENAKSMNLAAKGNFDPKLYYQFNDKYFNEKNYYDLGNGGLSIPTKYGVDFKSGFERNEGVFLNPENNTPTQGLYYAQVSVPLVQGVMTDERRTILKQSQINIKASQAELDFQLNELFYKAGKSFLEWQLSFDNLSVYKNAFILGNQRFEAVKKSFQFGDRPAIDTVEAGIQVLDRLAGWQQAELEFKNKTVQLSGFLWMNNNMPAVLDSTIIPDMKPVSITDDTKLELNSIKSIVNLHPNIRAGNFKLEMLNVDKRLKMEKLKPLINLNYNPLIDAGQNNGNYLNNYKWGVSLNFPLFLRKERGELQSAKLKIQQSQLELDYKRNDLENRIRMADNERTYSKIQLEIFKLNIKNYESY